MGINRSKNQRLVPDNILVSANDNLSDSSMDGLSEKENKGASSENDTSRAGEHSIPESNIIAPISVLNATLLPLTTI